MDADAKTCPFCKTSAASALQVKAIRSSIEELQREKASRLATFGAISAVVSALAFLWGYSYTSNWSNVARAGLSNLAGQTDSTYALAQWCVTLGAIGFLVGLILFIVGLAQR
jgi:protein-S-isoprenylcysteine O-methyltransferase Ste14